MGPMTVDRVIVVGGGVAGAATALALHRAGIAAEVYEAHPSGGDDAGAFLTVMGNGMAALGDLGATEAVEAVSFPARAVSLRDARGVQLGRRPIEGAARSMTRADLYRALQELAVARGIPVHHGKRMTGASIDRDGVAVTFADGSVVAGDLLVGADGIHSRTRRLIDPGAPEPRYSGQHVVYGYAPGNPAGADEDEYHMVRGSRAFFGFTVPAGDGRTWWFARINREPRTTTAPPGNGEPPTTTATQGNGDARTTPAPGGNRAPGTIRQPGDSGDQRGSGDRRSNGESRALVVEMFRDDPTPAAAIITATADVVGTDSYDIPTTPRWHNDRMVLVGDAAHAATPAAAQGASMALEDAVAVAAALREHGDPATAFAAYETGRRARTEETVAASARLVSDQ
jgi:2-polyprenyl-6-methoxyphenol hydroxylase-like FAD-dependent oxidoreductase